MHVGGTSFENHAVGQSEGVAGEGNPGGEGTAVFEGNGSGLFRPDPVGSRAGSFQRDGAVHQRRLARLQIQAKSIRGGGAKDAQG